MRPKVCASQTHFFFCMGVGKYMKKFAEVCLYNQCIIFIAAVINHVNINVY